MGMGADSASAASSQIGNYRAPMPSLLTKYMDNLAKGGFLDMPSFNEMFGSYKDVANREADRQAAKITESMGAMGGGRYSSALLNRQSKLRSDVSMDLANKASEYQMGLRQQQFQEVMGPGSLQYAANEAGMNRMWGDFLRRTSPPPLLDYGMAMSQSYGLPATVVQ